MLSADGRYVITFNGEIYNYRELREELKSKGHQFRTDTDTEVLLAAFAQWGAGLLTSLERHVCFRRLGQSGANADAGPRPRWHQAALLRPSALKERDGGCFHLRVGSQSNSGDRTR